MLEFPPPLRRPTSAARGPLSPGRYNSKVPSPLWIPSAARVARARMTAFMRGLEATHEVDLPDYPALYEFSISRPADFWRAVWTFCDVRGEIGDRIVIDFDKMPGARFFPDARLNFAANLLRRRDDSPALIFNGEGQQRRTMSHRELYSQRDALCRGAAAGRDRARRSRRRLHAESAGDDRCRTRRRGDRRGVDLLLTRLRGRRRARPLRPDRPARAGGTRRLRLRRQGPPGASARQSRPRRIAVRGADGDRSLRRRRAERWTTCGTENCGRRFSVRRIRRPSSSSCCRSITRSTSSTRRERPASPSASSTVPAARWCSTSRNTSCTATSDRAIACSTSRPAAG